LTAPGRVGRWLDAVRTEGLVLDLGCGSGSFLAAVGRSVEGACGIDIAMRWLIVARKRLDEDGLGEIPLACACAENLPIGSDQIASVIAGDVIEHVGGQEATLNEAHRVLRPGGRLFLASPNRYSLAPEPHVQVWGVGYLPRRWMAGYVRLVRGIEFRAIRTLGFFEWRRLLRASHFGGGLIDIPPLPVADLAEFGPLKTWIARIYNAVVTTRPGQWLARGVGPLFHVVCEKTSEQPPRSSTRATRRRSTRSAVPR
jgi:SAM-dependent methyltransferase